MNGNRIELPLTNLHAFAERALPRGGFHPIREEP